ncbi:MAG: ribose 5-phosphate isomerase B [Bacteroidia bacterium]|nr:ribose 5-phosphate isomerase B [Bacteroidia bacterium]MCX7651409.1 ribose 5-phosphate isomerase B [Bacteroidia bacterium]MDW8417044.1 ribose 5-phosphate isomerase B [Bacteroidia bacterium]
MRTLNMRIWTASDHAGFPLKAHITRWLTAQGYEVIDIGTHSEESTDYPLWVHQLAQRFPPEEKAILICGTGNGVCMTANRYPQVRAALAWNSEVARLARAHNDANVLCLPGRFISTEEAEKAVRAFLSTPFEGGRHERRISQINPSQV